MGGRQVQGPVGDAGELFKFLYKINGKFQKPLLILRENMQQFQKLLVFIKIVAIFMS